jgi:signal transduction histidine kinase/HAMP domain-containing protein
LLTAFLLLAIGPLSLVGYVAFNQVRTERQHDTIERLGATAGLEEARLRDWLADRRVMLDRLASDPDWAAGLNLNDATARQSAARAIAAAQQQDAAFSQVFLVIQTRDSEQWLSSDGEINPRPRQALALQDLDRMTACLQGSGFQLAAPIRATNEMQAAVVGFTTMISAPNGLSAGVILPDQDAVVYLINRDQQRLPLTGNPLGNIAHGQGTLPALAGQSGSSVYRNDKGVQVIGVYRRLNDLGLTLVAEQDEAEAFARSNGLAAGLIGAVLGVALLTTIIAAVVTRQITRPIVLLTEAALKMSGGDLSVRVSPTRQDEIGILSGVFNTMAAELAGLYAGLEQKVAERTHELQQAKEQIQYHAWQLSISAEVGRITTSILDLNKLLECASELIRDAFQLDHVGVYLLDPGGQMAVLFNNVGRMVPAHERQLLIAGDHPVSLAISQRAQRRVTRPCSPDNAEPVCELVLPLALGARPLGALDLTTRDAAGFSDLDQGVLQALADQLSVAIENARTYSQEHQAADEMREIDRLRGQFLTSMSHQLATYLNNILGFSKLMLKGLDGPLTERQTQDLAAIRQSGQHLKQLLDDILELANLEVGAIALQREPVRVESLIESVHSGLSSILVKPQVRFQTQIEPDLPEINADANRLRQLLTNLVMTASEMCHDGVISLVVARQVHQVSFQVSAPAASAGLEGDHAISLALSRKLIEMHGGRLQVEQHQDNLTVFGFSLPVSVESGAPGLESQA